MTKEISVSQLAKIKRVSRQAIHKQIKKGKIKANKIGSFYVINYKK